MIGILKTKILLQKNNQNDFSFAMEQSRNNLQKASTIVEKRLTYKQRKYSKNYKKAIKFPSDLFYYNKYSYDFRKAGLVSLKIYPNNAFGTYTDVRYKVKDSGDLCKTVKRMKNKKAKDYNIKFTKKGLKSKVMSFLSQFLTDIEVYIHAVRYKFIAIDIAVPASLRKKVVNLIYTTYIKKLFQKKIKVYVNIRDAKVFNGCDAPKKVRKKRKSFRLKK